MRKLILAAMLALAPLPAMAAELLMFDAEGCYWCDRWIDEVGDYYHETREGNAAPLRTVSLDNPMPVDLIWLRGVRASPTFVLIEDGREVGRIVGYHGEQAFWRRMENIFRGLAVQRL